MVSLAGLLLNAFTLVQIYLPAQTVVDMGTTSTPSQIRIVLSNVYTANQQEERLINTILKKHPDLIVVQEINDRWAKALEVLDKKFPYQKVIPRSDNFGIGLYSKYPLDDIEVLDLAGNGIESISAKIITGDETISLIATHPLPPINRQAAVQQDQHFKRLIKRVRFAKDNHVLVIGDLNTTLWSYRYQDLLDKTSLFNARQGKGIYTSWSAGGYIGSLLKIPLDHILTSKGMVAAHFETLGDVGSDHLPIFAEINY